MATPSATGYTSVYGCRRGPDQNDYQRQKNFDDALATIPTIDLSGYGPTIEEFQRLLFNTNRRIRGFEIVQARA